MSNVNQNQPKKSYFNQTLEGVGYLNRIEWLAPENGDPYLVATINSVVGPESKTWNTRFDCTVASTAREDLEFISAHVEDGDAKIFVAFRAGDLKLSTFVHKSGKNAGQPGVAARVRLMSLGYCSIDGIEIELPSQLAKREAEASKPVEVPADANAPAPMVMPPPFVHPSAALPPPPPPPRLAQPVRQMARSAPQPSQRAQPVAKPGFGARFVKALIR